MPDDASHPALWGGVECTIARVGDRWRDQVRETGHRDRPTDLDAVAALGIRTLRYPVLWESVEPHGPDERDWSWPDERLERLRRLEIEPIAGLVHHGSGPAGTNLLDPAFPEKLARYAGAVARRYPWMSLYTPVNEPLTTARFSALYGHWYPHAASEGAFLRALVIQCRGVLLAMRAIRAHTPRAKLVQTEDLGRTFSTPALAAQADYENERRWLSLDLLCGKIDGAHPWRPRLLESGATEAELDDFLTRDGAPDIVGINHYLTSERYLDERVDAYPPHLVGGNGRDVYADAEAVRLDLPEALIGPKARLREAWERYRLPLAVTEVHHGCSREEQLRWLAEVWAAAGALRQEGVDLRAVTVWSLFGAIDWNSLLVRDTGFYEPGAFDIRGEAPRPTAIARAAASLARTGEFDHPVLDRPGWWHRRGRLYAPAGLADRGRTAAAPRRLLITGATGTLGRAFSRVCAERALDHVLTTRCDLDIANERSVIAALQRHRPWAVINTAGFVRVADADAERDACLRENADGAAILAGACARLGIPLVTFSSDLVFDGRLGRAYLEDDPVSPSGAYGESKALAERRVLEAHPDALVVRTSAFFGPWDVHNFAYASLAALAAGRRVEASADEIVSPTYVPDLVAGTLDLLVDGERGIRHCANTGAISWKAFALRVAKEAGMRGTIVPAPERERRITALASRFGSLLPPLEDAVGRFVRDCESDWRASAPTAHAASARPLALRETLSPSASRVSRSISAVAVGSAPGASRNSRKVEATKRPRP